MNSDTQSTFKGARKDEGLQSIVDNDKNKWYRPVSLLTALVCTIFIISFAVVLTLNFKPLYYFDISHLKITETSGMTEGEIRENYDALIDYNSVFYSGELEFPTLDMSETGQIHFEEVKAIFCAFQYLCMGSFLIGLVLVIFQLRRRRYGFLKVTAALSVLLPVALGLLIALNWERAFVLFHEVFFDNDYWIFDAATDPVITILPDEFFMHCAVMILACILAGSLLCLLAARLLGKRRA
ncbi:MAG: TIGR01906 family membrane protein [Bacillota bacterium]|nr:TIGR01906 family membrane protein [Bacillota bacterium]